MLKDIGTLYMYRPYILNVQKAIPKMLKIIPSTIKASYGSIDNYLSPHKNPCYRYLNSRQYRG